MQTHSISFKKVAIIVGDGNLPFEVLKGVKKLNINYLIVKIDGVKSKIKESNSVISFSFERISELFSKLKAKNVDSISFCGYMKRPTLNTEKINEASRKILEPILNNSSLGDEALFREILNQFEKENLKPISLSELIPESYINSGFLTSQLPTKPNRSDAFRAEEIFVLISSADLGQSLVVVNGICLAVETSPGTDSMLKFAKQYSDKNKSNSKEGVFYKAPKINQNIFIDSPVIGESTIRWINDAGLAGAVIKENSVIILNKTKTIDLANKLGVFIWAKK